MEVVQTLSEIERFRGLPARRCDNCGGTEAYISANVPVPACVTCNPPTEAATTRLYAVLDGSRLRYRLDPTEAVTGQSGRRGSVETEADVIPHLGRASYFEATERGREFERRLEAGEIFPMGNETKEIKH